MLRFGAIVDQLTLVDADVSLTHGFFDQETGNRYFSELSDEIAWRQEYLRLGARNIPIPRLSAWYADPGKSYTYSGIRMQPLAWTGSLKVIRSALSEHYAVDFNSVLLNLYRDGNDSVGWHSDDEPELGVAPVIASVSLGASRRFIMRHKSARNRMVIVLEHGSVLLMRGLTQHCWQHQLPKTRTAVGPRINLTFRYIRS